MFVNKHTRWPPVWTLRPHPLERPFLSVTTLVSLTSPKDWKNSFSCKSVICSHHRDKEDLKDCDRVGRTAVAIVHVHVRERDPCTQLISAVANEQTQTKMANCWGDALNLGNLCHAVMRNMLCSFVNVSSTTTSICSSLQHKFLPHTSLHWIMSPSSLGRCVLGHSRRGGGQWGVSLGCALSPWPNRGLWCHLAYILHQVILWLFTQQSPDARLPYTFLQHIYM